MNSSTSHGDDDAFFVEFRDVWLAYNEELLRANHCRGQGAVPGRPACP